jgi:TolB-like protein
LEQEETLLHYRILDRLGEGGMGVVYRAEDTRMGRTVALKVLREDLAADEEWKRRFEREVRVASSFNHPGIATLYDFQADGETSFYTMEFVEGCNLRESLKKKGVFPVPQLIHCAVQMAEALAEAHRKGVIHRDLKPENIMESTSGYYKILDFGLARLSSTGFTATGSGSRVETLPQDTTQAGKIVGTVSYMSPEQAQGTTVDARSDVFSFGSLLYELITGETPFKRHNAIATFHAIVHEQPKPVNELRPEVPQELEWIIARCLAKAPGERYQTAAEVAGDLRAFQSGSDSGTRWASAVRGYPGANVVRSWRTWGSSSRRWTTATWAAAIVVLGVVAGGLWLFPPAGKGIGVEPQRPAGPTPPPAAISSVVPAASQRSIAVSSFVDNTRDPQVAWLAQGIPEMITTELAGAGDLTVISTQRLNDLLSMAGREGKGAVDGATATELARWAGAGIVVSGSIYKTRDRYRINTQAYDTATGQVLTASRVEGTDVFALVDQLTAELMNGLQVEGPRMVEAEVVPTSSEDAFRFYTDGMNMYKDLRFDEGVEAFRRSVDADPTFVLAQMRLGMSLFQQGNHEGGIEWITRASADPDKLPERERMLVKIIRGFYEEQDPGAVAEDLEAFTMEFPEDQEGNFWVAQARADVEGDRPGAIRVLHGVLRQEPDHLPAMASLARHMAALGSAEEAVRILEDYRMRHPRAAKPIARIIETFEAGAEPDLRD